MCKNDLIQFARLLDGIHLADLTSEQMQDVCISMDLEPHEVNETFRRAGRMVDAAKANLHKSPVEDYLESKEGRELSESDLDDLVHDVASGAASNANNEGVQGQINFLRSMGWSEDDIVNTLREKAGESA